MMGNAAGSSIRIAAERQPRPPAIGPAAPGRWPAVQVLLHVVPAAAADDCCGPLQMTRPGQQQQSE